MKAVSLPIIEEKHYLLFKTIAGIFAIFVLCQFVFIFSGVYQKENIGSFWHSIAIMALVATLFLGFILNFIKEYRTIGKVILLDNKIKVLRNENQLDITHKEITNLSFALI